MNGCFFRGHGVCLPSSADCRHLLHAFLDMVLVAGDLVPARFPGNHPPDQRRDLFIAASRPEGSLEVRFVVRQQAGAEVAVRRHAQAVAGMTEVAADRSR